MKSSEVCWGRCLPICLLLLVSVAANSALSSAALSSGRWVIWSEEPADEWEHGFVTGNGRHGARAMGHPENERIIINHEELFVRFWDRKIEMAADIADLLPDVRRLIDEGREKEAYTLSNNAAVGELEERGRIFRKAVIPHPAFDIHIEHENPGNPSDYRRQLDLETGETLTQWTVSGGGVEERVFSSRPHNVNVIQLKGTDGRRLDVALRLSEVPGRRSAKVKLKGARFDDCMKSSVEVSADWIIFDADYTLDPGGYQGVVRVIVKGGTKKPDAHGIRVSNTEEILLLVRVAAQQDGSVSQVQEIKAELEKMPDDYGELFGPHAKQHGAMFLRSILDLGAAAGWESTSTEKLIENSVEDGVTPLFLEQVYAMGRYLLISSCGKYPPPLQGIWGVSWNPPWQGGFVLDSNVNLAISSAAMSSLPECSESYINYIKGLLPGWRINARSYLGCRGFLAGNYTDPETGYLVHLGNTNGFQYWIGGAGWNLFPVYDHALLSGDVEFMKNVVLPLYLEMGGLYEDYMVLGKDGFYHIYPGMSPENRPKGQVKTLKDCTFDIAVAKEVFRILIELGEQFGLEKAEINRWRDYHTKLVPYRINKDGALAEWIPEKYGDFYTHRHASHLIQVYPWWEFKFEGADPKLPQAAKAALDKRFRFTASETHGLMHVALMATRLRDLEKVRSNLHRLASEKYFYNNMASSCRNGQRISNLDASLSIPRLLMEMLVFSRPGYIELLPAWPKGYPDGTLSGARIRGGHSLELTWAEGKLVAAIFHAGRDDSGTIVHGNVKRAYEFEAGKSYAFDGQDQLQQE